jgi:hypothetical protein
MNWRKVLVGILGLALVIECLWPIGGFLVPEKLLDGFKIAPTADTLFLTFVLTWCLLFVAIICAITLRLVIQNNPVGWTLSYALGLWWVGIGGSLFLLYGKVENLFLDGLKGAIIAVSAWASRPSKK